MLQTMKLPKRPLLVTLLGGLMSQKSVEQLSVSVNELCDNPVVILSVLNNCLSNIWKALVAAFPEQAVS